MKTSSIKNLVCVLLPILFAGWARAELIEFNFLQTSVEATPELDLLTQSKLITDTEAPEVAAVGSAFIGFSIAGMTYVGTPNEPLYVEGGSGSSNGWIYFSLYEGSTDEPQGACLSSLSLKGPHYCLAGRWIRPDVVADLGLQRQIPPAEYAALVDAYAGMGGQDWSYQAGWNHPAAVRWAGVWVSGFQYDWSAGQVISTGTVTTLSLGEQGQTLRGTIPESVGNLVNLRNLSLFSARFAGDLHGPIPNSFGNLVNLRELNLRENRLNGSIPESLGNLVNLVALELDANQLSGAIPGSFGNLVSLRYLGLYNNQLSGTIPANLGNLVNLEYLSLWGNQLVGTIPTSVGDLRNLSTLELSLNQLSGTIPTSLGNLSKLGVLSLSANQLSGSIPESLGNLENLRSLDLGGNELTGSIPSSIGSLQRLEDLFVGRNQLSGDIPSSFRNLDLNQLDVSYNCLDISPGSRNREILADISGHGYVPFVYYPQNPDCSPTVTGDLDGDQCVDRKDLTALMDKIHARAQDLAYDLNGDGKVDVADARFLILHFTNRDGSSCPP